nr:immunoglobulin heavy chain junction region [Macaca mulatta]MOW86635.1 immunoglobulin heavy chain junction region [Macaca mulatta]MOW86739.1 immunoglobulin heavy chain junction region [Macaca mulatta]MOW87018.1 immunoglobulin heavy chain junction region [Macaca mulatta]MOW87027.1 immunoglobulin heavy chain junction region [Macaca mulatta]
CTSPLFYGRGDSSLDVW